MRALMHGAPVRIWAFLPRSLSLRTMNRQCLRLARRLAVPVTVFAFANT